MKKQKRRPAQTRAFVETIGKTSGHFFIAFKYDLTYLSFAFGERRPKFSTLPSMCKKSSGGG